MNNSRRKRINESILALKDAQTKLEQVLCKEQEALDQCLELNRIIRRRFADNLDQLRRDCRVVCYDFFDLFRSLKPEFREEFI